MQRLRRHDAPAWRPSRPVVTLGVFDGVHCGHAAVVGAAVDAARRREVPAIVVTFDPHPRALVGQAPAAVATLQQRLDALNALGVDGVWVMEFDRDLADEDAEAFAARVFQSDLDASGVVLGHDARFGRGRRGDPDALARWLRPAGAFVHTVAPVLMDGRPVSSSRVREAVAAARMDDAARLLGRPFAVRGAVEHGRALARQLGLPTMNLRLGASRLAPPPGVYAARVVLDDGEGGFPPPRRADDAGAVPDAAETPGRDFGAVVNVGIPPDGNERERLVEAHAFGFSGDAYGRAVEVAFGDRLRAPLRFSGPDEARARLAQDAQDARAWLAARVGATGMSGASGVSGLSDAPSPLRAEASQ